MSIGGDVLSKVNHTVGEAQSKLTVIKSTSVESTLHIVFSTDCSAYQDWQSLLVFHSARQVGQMGRITRIASGCDDKKKKELRELYQRLWDHEYDAHFTPDFKRTADGRTYDFYNKPYGVRHWIKEYASKMENGHDMVVAIIDPDFVFLRPLTLNISCNPNNIFYREETPNIVPEKVREGVAVGQLYGLGAPWVKSRRDFNKSNICPPGSPCLTTTKEFGEEHYSVGPPYLLHIKDLTRLTYAWCEMVPKVYQGYPELLAEM